MIFNMNEWKTIHYSIAFLILNLLNPPEPDQGFRPARQDINKLLQIKTTLTESIQKTGMPDPAISPHSVKRNSYMVYDIARGE